MLAIKSYLLLFVFLVTLSSCSLLELEQQSEQLDDIASISGVIEVSGVEAPV